VKKTNPETKDRSKELAEAHWAYLRSLLMRHNISEDVIGCSMFHYQTAFKHGYKHGREDALGRRD